MGTTRTITLFLLATLSFCASSRFAVATEEPDAPDTVQTFPVPAGAWALASDGANIWVTNYNLFDGKVTKLRASDGAVVGVFDTGLSPDGITFDGANIWTANQDSNSVTKLRASDGAVLGTFGEP
jgi:DNA-binding beta-propeller fold protein YncE